MRKSLSTVIGGAVLAGVVAAVVREAARSVERSHPPVGKFIDVEGVRLHYLDRGAGSPVVLLHGNGAMIADYQTSGIVDVLARRNRVVVFDRPGFGHSDRPRDRVWTPEAQAELFAEAFRRLDIVKPVVVGHSWGTLVAIALALDHPDQAGALLLISGYYYPTARLDVALLSAPALPVLGDWLRYTVLPPLTWLLMPRIMRRLFNPTPIPLRFRLGFPANMVVRPWQLRAIAEETVLMIPAAKRLSGRYDQLRVPVAVLAGDGDRVVDSAEQSFRLARQLGCEFRLLSGSGHMAHHADPQAVIDALERLRFAHMAGPDAPLGEVGFSKSNS